VAIGRADNAVEHEIHTSFPPWYLAFLKLLLLLGFFTAAQARSAQIPGETAVLQLNPPIPMNTPKGEGFAHILIDYGPESDLYWTVLITATGEIWTYANRHVRASKNITLGRTDPSVPAAVGSDPIPMRPRSVESPERS
jgi:hypothetical protein